MPAKVPKPTPASKPLFEEFSLEELAKHMAHGMGQNIIVMSGAGLSVAAGIPDFRSPGTGLYAQLAQYDLPEPEAVFDIDFFRGNPKPFWVLAKEMWPGSYPPTDAHLFIRLLADKGRLLRNYTQNIDCLERAAGIPEDLLVEAHGSFASASTIERPFKSVSVHEIKERLDQGETCIRDAKSGALVKPDIVFFGEDLPVRFYQLLKRDFPKCDLLIVMGTSLQVTPFADLTRKVGKECPRLLINQERAGDFRFYRDDNWRDVGALGDCQHTVNRLVDLLGWTKEFEALKRRFPGRIHHQRPKALPALQGLNLKPEVLPEFAQLSLHPDGEAVGEGAEGESQQG